MEKYLTSGNKLVITGALLDEINNKLEEKCSIPRLLDKGNKRRIVTPEDIASYLERFYKTFQNKNIGKRIGLHASTYERAIKGKGGKYSSKFRYLDFLCYASFECSLAQVVFHSDLVLGNNVKFEVPIPEYAEEEIKDIFRQIRTKNYSKSQPSVQPTNVISGEIIKAQNEINESNISQSDNMFFDTSKENYKILILPFRNPEKDDEITPLGRFLVNGLIEKNISQKLCMEIKYLSSITNNISNEEARKVGSQYKADIVIWGNDSKPKGASSHVIYFHYVIINEKEYTENLLFEGKTGKFETVRLIEIKEGNMHLEIDEIIYWFLGIKLFLKKDYVNALSFFNKIKKEKHLNEYLYLYIAGCYFFLKLFNEAKICFEKVVKINPDYLDAHYFYAHMLEDNFNDKEGAKEHYEKALKIDKDSVKVHVSYGTLLCEKFNDIERAKEHYDKALKIKPNDANILYNYAILFEEKFNDINGAKEYYDKVLAINPNHFETHLNYAILLNKLNEVKEVNWHYKRALEIDPNNVNAHNGYAIFLYEKNDDIETAKEHLERALEIDPNNVIAHTCYAVLLYEKNNDLELAKMHCERALKINPNYAKAHLHYAYFLEESNDFEGAKEHYERTLEIDPNNVNAHFYYIRLLNVKYNDIEGAGEHYGKALEIIPDFEKKIIELFSSNS